MWELLTKFIVLLHPLPDDYYCSVCCDQIIINFLFVMQTLEYVCDEYGGRVNLAKAYYEGLTKSIAKNFNGSGIIASMQQCNDFFFLGTKQVSMGRVGKH